MALQAHSSSANNILLPLINRTPLQQAGTTTTIQIGNNYSCFPPQPGGSDGAGLIAPTFLHHQSHLNNNFPVGNSSANQRKRGREEDNMNQFISNVRKKQSQIESRNNNVDVSTGLRLAFNDHHYSINHQPYGLVSLSSSQDLSNLINQQGDEIERFLQAQGEEVRRMLADKRQRHYSALIEAAKDSASRMIREKEAVSEKAARHNAELEAQASQLITEAQVWQAKARAQEAVAVALQAQLQQTMASGCVSQGGDQVAEDAESSYVDPERVVVVSGPGCKACGKRVASVVLLPCRHLCVCSECDDVVQTCPLCLSFRSSSIEVYMS